MKNKIITIFLSLFLFLSFSLTVSAHLEEHYYFRTIDVRNGLSHNTIYQILQDKTGFMWFGTKDGLNRYDGLSCKVYKRENSNLGCNFITALYQDINGKIWVGTDIGVYIYDPLLDDFTKFSQTTADGTDIYECVSMIQGDASGNIWMAIECQGLFQYRLSDNQLTNIFNRPQLANCTRFWETADKMWLALYADNLYYMDKNKKGDLIPYKDSEGKEIFRNDIIYCQKEGPRHCSYVGSSSGLYELDRLNGKSRCLLNAYVRALYFRTENELWVGTESGLYIYNVQTSEVKHLTVPEQDDMYALADNAIYSLCCDREKGMWIGSYFGGVNYSPYQCTAFEKIYPRGDFSYLGRRVREFCESNDGTLWVGTEDKGLFNYNPLTGDIKAYKNPKLYHNIHGLCLDGSELWVGTFSGGLNRINLETGALQNYRKGEEENTLCANDAFCVCKTRKGDIFVGTTSGAVKYNRATDDFTRIPELKNKFVYSILEDSTGKLWVATYSYGVYCYDERTASWTHYVHDENDDKSLAFNKVISIYEDSARRLWFMTMGGGFCRYDAENNNFISYDMSSGFPSNIIYKMVEDRKGDLWLTSNNGLTCFNVENNTKHNYTTANGLLSNQFNFQSGYCDANGRLYMGCIKGFIAFHPETFVVNDYLPEVVITDLRIFNKPILVSAPGSPLQKSIVYSDKLDLEAHQNSLSFHVAALSYQAPEMNGLQYKMENFDEEWYAVGPGAIINYSHLPYGRYKLRIRGSNNDGKWNQTERVLKIHIHPPFYLSACAFAIYGLLFVLCLVGLIWNMKQRVQRKQELLKIQMDGQKEKELYTAKFNFFTNVAHEIRTPLTLIKCPLENVLRSKKLSPEIKDDLEVMDLNANRLLELVNQLLDFRKTETKNLKLNIERCDVVEVSRQLNICFASMAKEKRLTLYVEQPEKLEAMVDKEAFTKILSNLLTNALKYSESFIRVRMWKENEQLFFVEENDGVLIPQDMREKIFEPFVQYKMGKLSSVPGTGIGLALARSLAILHGGSLSMEKAEGVNRFVLVLPLWHEELQAAEPAAPVGSVAETVDINEKIAEVKVYRYTLMVVEDNLEMLDFVKRQLVSDYNVITATNGVEALELLKEHMVNLVVSDVMMPEMDGLELCKSIKTHLDYSHIPVVLLTAKTALQSKIEGMRQGADAYIEKPFSVEYLKVCVANLLSNREKLQATFANSPFVETNSMAMTPADEAFLKKMNEVVMANLQKSEFSIDDLASALNMSRSSLNRKIKGLLDMTPNDYIRLERLKKSVQLLKDGECKINEICYMVGFNTPSYFAKCFQKQFGVLPKDIIKDTKK